METHSSHHHFHDFLLKPEDETNHILPSWYLFAFAWQFTSATLQCLLIFTKYLSGRTSEPQRIRGLSKMLRSSKLLHCPETEWTILTPFLTDPCLTPNKGDFTTLPSFLFLTLIMFITKINNWTLTYNLNIITSCTALYKWWNRS